MGAWLFCFCEFSDDLGKRGQTPLGKAFRIF